MRAIPRQDRLPSLQKCLIISLVAGLWAMPAGAAEPLADAARPAELRDDANRAVAATTRLAGELAMRAQAVRTALTDEQKADIAARREARDGFIRELFVHGVLTSPTGEADPALLRCAGNSAADRVGCWVDTLVWAQHSLVDGVGLGARSQPLPPHRKHLSAAERDALTQDAARRRARAQSQVLAAIAHPNLSPREHVDGWLTQAGPGRWPVYRHLVEGLARYRDLAEKTAPKLSDAFPVAGIRAWRSRKEKRLWLAALTPEHRTSLRDRLCFEDYCALAPQGPPLPAAQRPQTEPLQPALVARLRQWQSNRGLRPSGMVDAATLAELRVPMADRVQQLRLALQRIRDTEVGASEDFIVANIPSFRLEVWRDGRMARAQRTQVGKGKKRVRRRIAGRKRWLWVPGLRTPMVTAELRHMVINPRWVVPSSIRREYRWKIRSDPEWPEKNGFEIRTAANGGTSMIMKPGADNLLGQVKFLFPNTHLVYLHDTSAQRWFKEPTRLRSHGCVRVEDATGLARYLVDEDGDRPWSDKKWAKYLAEKEDKWVRLAKPLPIYLAYWTADAATDGKVRFYRDAYSYDELDQQRAKQAALGRLNQRGAAPDATTNLPAGPARPAIPSPVDR